MEKTLKALLKGAIVTKKGKDLTGKAEAKKGVAGQNAPPVPANHHTAGGKKGRGKDGADARILRRGVMTGVTEKAARGTGAEKKEVFPAGEKRRADL